VGRRGNDFEVERNGCNSQGDESERGEDAEESHVFAEGDE